jgi:hypothetical protein
MESPKAIRLGTSLCGLQAAYQGGGGIQQVKLSAKLGSSS